MWIRLVACVRQQFRSLMLGTVVVIGSTSGAEVMSLEVLSLDPAELEEKQTKQEARLRESSKFWEDARKDDLFGFDLWTHANPTEDGRRVAFTTHPLMISDVLPVWWDRFGDVPLVNVLHEVDDGTRSDAQITDRLVEIFNIRVLTNRNQLQLPDHATLVAYLSMETDSVQMNIPMRLTEDQSYYLDDPQALLRELTIQMSGYQVSSNFGKPKFWLRSLKGIDINADTVENMRPFGIEVGILFRFGDTNVKSEFQWGGRSDQIPLSYPEMPFLVAGAKEEIL